MDGNVKTIQCLFSSSYKTLLIRVLKYKYNHNITLLSNVIVVPGKKERQKQRRNKKEKKIETKKETTKETKIK